MANRLTQTKTVVFFFTNTVLCAILVSVTLLTAQEKPGMIAEDTSDRVKLPEPRSRSDTSVEDALYRRRSTREYREGPVSLAELSQLLWAAQGITDLRGHRTSPSAGALYPLELYVLAGDVKDLSPGIYSYKPHRHELVRVERGDRRIDLCNASLGQSSVRNAAAVIVFSAVYDRTTVKYGERGIRYVHMEAGHAAQNVYLQAVSLNLGTVVIGAFNDDAVKKIMKMTDREKPLSIMPLGRR